MYKLGYAFDLGLDVAPVDLSAAAVTGKRTNLRNAQNLNVVVFKGAGVASSVDPVLTLNQWQAATGGAAAPLNVDHCWVKSAAAMANTETWTRFAVGVPGVGSNTVTLTGLALLQAIVAIEINTKDLADGYDYVSVDTAKASTFAQVAGLLYLLADLSVRRTPVNLQPNLF